MSPWNARSAARITAALLHRELAERAESKDLVATGPVDARGRAGAGHSERSRRPECPISTLANSQLLGHALALEEQQQVVAAAGLRVGADMLKPPNGCDADQRAGALAVEVEVADVELVARALEPRAVARVDRAGQAVLGVVRDRERVVEVLAP